MFLSLFACLLLLTEGKQLAFAYIFQIKENALYPRKLVSAGYPRKEIGEVVPKAYLLSAMLRPTRHRLLSRSFSQRSETARSPNRATTRPAGTHRPKPLTSFGMKTFLTTEISRHI